MLPRDIASIPQCLISSMKPLPGRQAKPSESWVPSILTERVECGKTPTKYLLEHHVPYFPSNNAITTHITPEVASSGRSKVEIRGRTKEGKREKNKNSLSTSISSHKPLMKFYDYKGVKNPQELIQGPPCICSRRERGRGFPLRHSPKGENICSDFPRLLTF